MIRGSWCSKSRLAKAARAEVAVQQKNEKWHAAVAPSTFSSQNEQSTTFADQFLKFRCPTARCGAKHIFQSKCTTHLSLSPSFEIPMSKNGTPLQREAHLQVENYKTLQLRSNFWSSGLEKWHAAVARSTFSSQNNQKLTGSGYFLKLRCRKMARGCGAKHICKAKCTK